MHLLNSRYVDLTIDQGSDGAAADSSHFKAITSVKMDSF